MEKKKDLFKNVLNGNIKNDKLLLILAGIALLIILMLPTSNKAPQDTVDTQTTVYDYNNYTWYQEYLEQRLTEVLINTCNIGNAKVMITLKNTPEKILEMEGSPDDKSAVRVEDSYKKTPYITMEKLPEVAGVVVVAQNGDQPEIISEITQAVEALLSVPTHRIKVLKIKN